MVSICQGVAGAGKVVQRTFVEMMSMRAGMNVQAIACRSSIMYVARRSLTKWKRFISEGMSDFLKARPEPREKRANPDRR